MPAADNTLGLRLRHSRGDFTLDVQAELPLHGITALFGPSGSGKTTLLRLIAGLDRDARGELRHAGECWQDSQRGHCLPAHRRPVGYLFQDARLFAHLDVAANLAFAARRARGDGPTLEQVVGDFDLATLAGRDIATLSGGETRRVALARTLLARPRLLLLDEPLSGLDAGRRDDILALIEELPMRYGLPVIYVSHAIDEVVRLADRVLALDGGRVVANGDALPVLNEVAAPGLRFESSSIIEARVVRDLPDLQLAELAFEGQPLYVPRRAARDAGETIRLRVRAGDVAIALDRPGRSSFRNVLEGRVHDVRQPTDSPFAEVAVDIGGSRLRAEITRHAVIELELAAGMPVFVLLKAATFDERAAPAD